MPKIDIAKLPERRGSGYPAPFHEKAAGRLKKALGDAAGLSDFGVNLTQLPPGAWSSQRHWHSDEDEFVFVLSGELTLVTDSGRTTLSAGACAGFPKGVADGHHFVNEGSQTAIYLEIGTRSAKDVCSYPDIDLRIDAAEDRFTHKDGTPYPERE